jgi:hypothetical protein
VCDDPGAHPRKHPRVALKTPLPTRHMTIEIRPEW